MSRGPSWQGRLHKGGMVDAPEEQREAALQVARDAGLAAFVVDCDRARSRSAVLRAVVKAVDFPEFFGSDLDALFDCLCDTTRDNRPGLYLWFDKLHSGDPTLAEDAGAIAAVCGDVAEYATNNGLVFSYTIQHAGRHPDPEPGVSPTPYAGEN